MPFGYESDLIMENLSEEEAQFTKYEKMLFSDYKVLEKYFSVQYELMQYIQDELEYVLPKATWLKMDIINET